MFRPKTFKFDENLKKTTSVAEVFIKKATSVAEVLVGNRFYVRRQCKSFTLKSIGGIYWPRPMRQCNVKVKGP
jgi:hypothetical protein